MEGRIGDFTGVSLENYFNANKKIRLMLEG